MCESPVVLVCNNTFFIFPFNGKNRELLPTAREAESWTVATIEELRAKWGVQSRGCGCTVVAGSLI